MPTNGQKYTIGKSTVTLRIGDIIDSEADVLVSSDDDHFSMRSGVSKAIRQAAGDGISTELAGKVGKHKLGSVVVTSAGELKKQAHIFHGVTRLREFDSLAGQDGTQFDCLPRAGHGLRKI
ncbi:hypothetical protein G5V57_05890 [Nordella sp. HKS 07]|uniref:macro domain-containing protein n=1 Tax=Nordella sp. HKS 07 TaxID=2712222 RepID=UPI0013E1CCEB|nr:macro domain-containing protein [Nordella sp. HKS 07]QIG47304.1 hypothetical protein G5V57_05890 [Nordella sp. HKS 07]